MVTNLTPDSGAYEEELVREIEGERWRGRERERWREGDGGEVGR